MEVGFEEANLNEEEEEEGGEEEGEEEEVGIYFRISSTEAERKTAPPLENYY